MSYLVSLTNACFLPRNAMHSADYAVTRCPSVYPSVTLQYSTETAKYIIRLFSPSGILFSFFHTKRCGNISTGTTPNWGVKCKAVRKKITIFGQQLALSQIWYKIEP